MQRAGGSLTAATLPGADRHSPAEENQTLKTQIRMVGSQLGVLSEAPWVSDSPLRDFSRQSGLWGRETARAAAPLLTAEFLGAFTKYRFSGVPQTRRTR